MLPLRATIPAALLATLLGWPQPASATPDPTPDPTSIVSAPDAAGTQAVDRALADYEDARERVAGLSAQSSRLAAAAEAAEAEAGRLHDAVSGKRRGLLHALGDLLGPGDSELDRAAEAADDAALARRLADMVQAALADQIADTESARVAWERAQQRQARVEAAWTATEAAAVAIRRSRFQPAYDVRDPAQDRLNRAALRSWHDYLRELAAEAVVPPPIADVADPARITAPLEPVRDAHDDLTPGLAAVDPPGRRSLTVLPAETVRAVSEAFRRVGLPEVPGAVDPAAYACGGLAANAWGTADVALPAPAADQWATLRRVPASSMQTGDLVALGSRADGLAQTAVYVGHGRIVVVDPATGVAAVRPLPGQVLGVRRAGVPADGRPAPVPAGGLCGRDDAATSGDSSGPLVVPVAAGGYQLSAGFGSTSPLWSSGEHTGQDLAAPTGTPVVAAAPGTVTVEHPDWAGNLVRIDHGGGVETWYAHLSRVDVTPGQLVRAGDPVGLVGSRGNSTGPHLHFEVRLDGDPYDPTLVLDLPEAPRPAYANGDLPETALCPATSDGAQLLRCDAAVALRLLGAAYADALGTELCVTDSYRSRAGQERVFAVKPGLAAVPGTSVHGVGLAVDLCGGAERFGTAEHAWVAEHGPAYGWVHPGWAAAGGNRPEPWHFEYPGGAA